MNFSPTEIETIGAPSACNANVCRSPSAYQPPIDFVPLAACVVSIGGIVQPVGGVSSNHTVSPAGKVGCAAVAVMQAGPALPTWSNQAWPLLIQKANESTRRSSRRSALAGTSMRVQTPAGGSAPMLTGLPPSSPRSAPQ